MIRRMLAVAALLIGVATGGFLVLSSGSGPLPAPVARCSEQVDAFGCLTKVTADALQVGTGYALSVLRAEVDAGSEDLRSNCHKVAHGLGTEVGLSASDLNAEARAAGENAVLCDFGFVHGLLEGFAEHQGPDQMLPLGVPLCRAIAANADAAALCLHGFGHSVLIANKGDVTAAFKACNTLNEIDRFSCTSGASMQWAVNTPGTQAATAPAGLQYWPAVCETTTGTSRLGCLSQIWQSLVLYDRTDERRSTGYALSYCRETYGGEELTACVDGVGQGIWVDGQPEPIAAEKLCAQAGDDGLHLLCITGYANSRAVSMFDSSLMNEVCDVVATSIRDACRATAERDAGRRAAVKDPAWKN